MPMPGQKGCGNSRSGGFTLVEVLVALSIMALLAAVSWRGIHGMNQAQARIAVYTDEVQTLQAGLQQWRSDLDAMLVWPDAGPTGPGSLDWDGRVLRVSRASADDQNALVVAWARSASDGMWRRWQSRPLQHWKDWQDAWEQAAAWGETGAPATTEGPRTVDVVTADGWQVQYWRGNTWTHPLSSSAESRSQQGVLPNAIRLQLNLPDTKAIGGDITVDWIRPDFGGRR